MVASLNKNEKRVRNWLIEQAKAGRTAELRLTEIQSLLGSSEQDASDVLDSLQQKQYIVRDESTALGFRLCPTSAQETVLKAIDQLTIRLKGRAPTLQEIATEIGKTKGTVHAHIYELFAKGWVEKADSKARSVRVTDPLRGSVGIPVSVDIMGMTGAGKRIADMRKQGELILASHLLEGSGSGELFSLEVDGKSMVDAGVLHGDLIVVHRQNTANEGQMVVAQLDNQPEPELTVRYYCRNGKVHSLKCYDSDPSPKEFTPGQMEIVGVVVGLVRPVIRALRS